MRKKMTSQLAEICGIHAGDGYLRNDGKRRELDISGNIEEKSYYDNHVIPLFEKIFDIKIQGKFFPSRSTYGFVVRERNIIQFLHELGFPFGKKSTIVEVPKLILSTNDKIVKSRFLRGLFDTDGSLTFDRRHKGKYVEFKMKYHYYPRIVLSTVSEKLHKQCSLLLKHLDIHHTSQIYEPNGRENTRYRIWIFGEAQLQKWFKIVGCKNISKLTRYYIWKKFGFCPPNTTLKQRKMILKNKLNPKFFYMGL
jgi:intein/homing endonuclease